MGAGTREAEAIWERAAPFERNALHRLYKKVPPSLRTTYVRDRAHGHRGTTIMYRPTDGPVRGWKSPPRFE